MAPPSRAVGPSHPRAWPPHLARRRNILPQLRALARAAHDRAVALALDIPDSFTLSTPIIRGELLLRARLHARFAQHSENRFTDAFPGDRVRIVGPASAVNGFELAVTRAMATYTQWLDTRVAPPQKEPVSGARAYAAHVEVASAPTVTRAPPLTSQYTAFRTCYGTGL